MGQMIKQKVGLYFIYYHFTLRLVIGVETFIVGVCACMISSNKIFSKSLCHLIVSGVGEL